MLNYYEIGQKIRKIRKAHGLSQETLAEKIGISTTHMSHIETGNTKLSLPVLVELADALEVCTDELLNRSNTDSVTAVSEELNRLLEQCSVKEARIIADVAKATKQALDQYL